MVIIKDLGASHGGLKNFRKLRKTGLFRGEIQPKPNHPKTKNKSFTPRSLIKAILYL